MQRWHLVHTAGVVLGVGIVGFFDGIMFHQILQLHNMLSAVYYPDTLIRAEINMFWDGLFHAFTWLTACTGIALLWRGVQDPGRSLPSTKEFVGALLLGGGLFNTIEGVINHHLLHLHHVVEREGESLWDLLFIGSGAALILIGIAMIRGAHVTVPAGGKMQPSRGH